MDNKVWAILRPHYSPTGELVDMNLCGSGFFITENIFVSAHHVLNESSFFPNSHFFNRNIFLVNPSGDKIEITVHNIYKLLPEIDVVMIKVEDKREFIPADLVCTEGDEVLNIGYPLVKANNFSEADLATYQSENIGKILKIVPDYNMLANDVRLFKKKVIVLDYTSELGFSGGPLLKNDKMIGLMSHLYPREGNAIALSIEEVLSYLE